MSGSLLAEIDRHRPALHFTGSASVRWRLNEYGDLRDFAHPG
jgi:hypothetical protein